MKELSIPLLRLQISERLAGALDSPEVSAVKITAMDLLTIIFQCLTAFIRYFTDNSLCTSLSYVSKKAKLRNRFKPGNQTLQDLRMKLKAASDNYTQAMVDLGASKSDQIIELVETGFNRIENQLQSANKPPGGTFSVVCFLI